MVRSRFNDPIEPTDLANMRQNGVRSKRLSSFATATAGLALIADANRVGSTLSATCPLASIRYKMAHRSGAMREAIGCHRSRPLAATL
jgi:hypothetical protein